VEIPEGGKTQACTLIGQTKLSFPPSVSISHIKILRKSVAVILTNFDYGAIVFYGLPGMENMIKFELFSYVDYASVHISEDSHIFIGTKDGLVLVNSFDEADPVIVPNTDVLTSTDIMISRLNYTLSSFNNLYKSVLSSSSVKGLKDTLSKFEQFNRWQQQIQGEGLLNFKISELISKSSNFFHDLCHRLRKLQELKSTGNFYLSDASSLETLADLPPNFPLNVLLRKKKENILRKYEVKRRIDVVRNMLVLCRQNAKKLSVSDMEKKIAFAQIDLPNTEECHAMIAELQAIEKDLCDAIAQQILESTNQGWMFVMECSAGLQKDLMNCLLQLMSASKFRLLLPTLQDMLATFIGQLEGAMSKENQEMLCKCKEKLRGEEDPAASKSDENIDLLAKKYMESLKKCKENVELKVKGGDYDDMDEEEYQDYYNE